MADIMGYYKGPGCGSTIFFRDEEEKITCTYCGSMFFREKNEYEKSLEFLRKQAIEDQENAKKEKKACLNILNNGQLMLICITIVIAIFGIIFHYLRI